MSRQAKPTPPPVLPPYWRHSHVSTPIFWAVAVWLAAAAIHYTAVPTLWCAAAAVAAAVLAPVPAIAVDAPLRTKWFAATLGATIGAYVTWCAAGTPLSREAALALIPGAAVFGVWWHWIVATHDHTRAAQRAEEARLEQAAATGDFPEVLANAGFKGVKAHPDDPTVHRIEDEGGLVATLQRLLLPATGAVTFEQLHAASNKIAIATRAKFPIRFLPGETLADVTVLRLYRDVLAETKPYPVDRRPASIHQPISLGVDELGQVQGVTFRELSGMLIGERGSGKSNLISTHLARLTGCTDALVWMIDGKGGRTAMPWVLSFLDGIGKPALDWVATEPAEMDAMLLAAVAAIEVRSRTGARRGIEKVHPTPQQPAIVLLVEEASLVSGTGDLANTKRAKLMRQIVILGRSEAVDVILVGQRGTISILGSGDMKSQLQYIVGLGISRMEDAQRVFGNDSVMSREALKYAGDDRYKGVMLVKSPGLRSVTPIKSWRMEPDTIPGVARTNAEHRPDLDAETADHVHAALERAGVQGGYFGRWDRFKAALERSLSGAVPGGSETAAAVPDPAPGTAGTGPAGTGPAGTGPAGTGPAGTGPAGTAGTAAARRGAEIVERARRAAREQRERSEFDQLIAASWHAEPPADVPTEERDDPDVIPPILRFVYRVFTARGDDRLPTQVIIDELAAAGPELTASKLGRLMNHCGVTSIENLTDARGKRCRGYALADVSRALAAVRDGRSKPPPQAFDWRP